MVPFSEMVTLGEEQAGEGNKSYFLFSNGSQR